MMTARGRTLRLALNDPGAFVPRRFDVGPEHDEAEPLVEWQARAVTAYLREQADSVSDLPLSSLGRAAAGLRTLADWIDERTA